MFYTLQLLIGPPHVAVELPKMTVCLTCQFVATPLVLSKNPVFHTFENVRIIGTPQARMFQQLAIFVPRTCSKWVVFLSQSG